MKFKNYNVFEKHRNSCGGGVALLVHKRWFAIESRDNLQGKHISIKIIDLNFHLHSKHKLVYINIYFYFIFINISGVVIHERSYQCDL